MDNEPKNGATAQEHSAPSFDRRFWDERWSEVLAAHATQIAQRPPNAYLTATAGSHTPRRALDAGCGHGSETLWLAACGWHVTAVDFSTTVPGSRPVHCSDPRPLDRRAHRVGRRRSRHVEARGPPLRPCHEPLRPCCGFGAANGDAAGRRGRTRRDTAVGRAPPDRPGDGRRDTSGRPGAGDGRGCDRSSRPSTLGDCHRRGRTQSRGRHWLRCRDLRTAAVLMVPAPSGGCHVHCNEAGATIAPGRRPEEGPR